MSKKVTDKFGLQHRRGRAIGNYTDNHKNNSIQFIRHPEVKSV